MDDPQAEACAVCSVQSQQFATNFNKPWVFNFMCVMLVILYRKARRRCHVGTLDPELRGGLAKVSKATLATSFSASQPGHLWYLVALEKKHRHYQAHTFPALSVEKRTETTLIHFKLRERRLNSCA